MTEPKRPAPQPDQAEVRAIVLLVDAPPHRAGTVLMGDGVAIEKFAGVAHRPATPTDIGIAGGRVVRL